MEFTCLWLVAYSWHVPDDGFFTESRIEAEIRQPQVTDDPTFGVLEAEGGSGRFHGGLILNRFSARSSQSLFPAESVMISSSRACS
jgi:hypothetical protein